jgi:hypothetical protein
MRPRVLTRSKDEPQVSFDLLLNSFDERPRPLALILSQPGDNGRQFDRRFIMKQVALVICLLGILPGTTLARAAGQDAAPMPLAERARRSERVVVGRVTSVSPMWKVNEFGDRLIVSVVRVAVDETLKGQVQASLDVEVEGGTIGDLTLHVSDEESFAPGERAVFYLTRGPQGVLVPHLRGHSLLKLDRSDRVAGSSLTLDEIRRTAAAGR